MSTYHIIFEGKLTGDVDIDQVKKNIASLFKMNTTQVEALFNGKPVAVKRNVDEATAKKYSAAFKKAGALCNIAATEVPVQKQAKPESSTTKPSTSTQNQNRTGRAAGKDIVDLEVPDEFGDLKMGLPGDPIPHLPDKPDAELPDLSGLSMGNDETPLQPPSHDKEPQVDISDLSMEKSD